LNGHGGYLPAESSLGFNPFDSAHLYDGLEGDRATWVDPHHTSHYIAGRLAASGFPVITYDDRCLDSRAISIPPIGLRQTLADMLTAIKVTEQDISRLPDELVSSQQIPNLYADMQRKLMRIATDFPKLKFDAVGLSGGAERLYHLLMFRDLVELRSAYIAGYFYPPCWSHAGDTYDRATPSFDGLFDWSQLVYKGMQDGVRVALVHNAKEGSDDNFFLRQGVVRQTCAIFRGTNAIEVRGDSNLCHEYDLGDYALFLSDVRNGIGPAPAPLTSCSLFTRTN
jgi:hypothetical protein